MADYGYAGKILKIDLTARKTTTISTSDYASKYIGGRGFGARLYWDMAPAEAKALSPENVISFVTGPFSGFDGTIAGNRWQVCGKSALSNPEAFSYGNLGGRWGMELKFAGYDAVAVQGKADSLVYIFIHDGEAEIKDASHLRGMTTYDTIDAIKAELGGEAIVATTGPAGENGVLFATIYGEGGASGSSGLGCVMGSKNLKAIAVKGSRKPVAANPERMQQIVERLKAARGPRRERPSVFGVPGVTTQQACYGCEAGCGRHMYPGEKNRAYKSFCQATNSFKKAVLDHYGKWNPAQLLGVRLCDANSLDSAVMEPIVNWLISCYKNGVITEQMTGLPLSQAGTPEFIEEVVRKITQREGFGDLLSQGVMAAAEKIGPRAVGLAHEFVHTRSGECKDYDPRMFITTSLMYATEPRRPIQQLHGISFALMAWLPFARGDKNATFTTDDFKALAGRFWGSEVACDFSTYAGKALAAKKVQDRAYIKDSLMVCDLAWLSQPANDPGMEAEIYSAITGNEMDQAGLYLAGERICNLQRAVQLRLGWGGRKNDHMVEHMYTEPLEKGSVFYNEDALVPGPGGKIISKLGCVVDRQAFDKLLEEYYQLRGWNTSSGLPEAATLKRLGLDDVAVDLKARGLMG
jgi:aldehyde:ferredoxin oxidoreductase